MLKSRLFWGRLTVALLCTTGLTLAAVSQWYLPVYGSVTWNGEPVDGVAEFWRMEEDGFSENPSRVRVHAGTYWRIMRRGQYRMIVRAEESVRCGPVCDLQWWRCRVNYHGSRKTSRD